MYFLDTNTCIYFLKGQYESIKNKLLNTPPNNIRIPAIVKAELILGAYKSQKKKTNVQKVEDFLEPFEIVPFSDLVTYTYADIRSNLEKQGQIIGPNDLLIASIVKFYDGILVSNNLKEFQRIKGLHTENWLS